VNVRSGWLRLMMGIQSMATTQTIWVLQWERYTGMAKTQTAPPEFWAEYAKIAKPRDGQITETEILKLRELMARFKLNS